MADDKVYTPQVIPDTMFPGQDGQAPQVVTESGGGSNQTYTQSSMPEQTLPTKRVATELLSVAMNTRSKKILQEFQFTPSGAIQVGMYTQGVNGDIRISPVGIIARNSLGDTTIAIDGETGDAVFAGEIQAGSFISGKVLVGDGNIQIDGDTKRMLFYDANGIPTIIIGLVS